MLREYVLNLIVSQYLLNEETYRLHKNYKNF